MPTNIEIKTGNRRAEDDTQVDIPYIEINLGNEKSVRIIGATPSQEYLEAKKQQTTDRYTTYRYLLGKRELTSMGNVYLEDFGLNNIPDRNSCQSDDEWIQKALALTTQAVDSGTFQKGIEGNDKGLGFMRPDVNTLLLFPGFAHALGGEPLPDMMAVFYYFDAVYKTTGKDWPTLNLTE